MLHLDREHGLNPGIELCFFCNKDKGLILFGSALKGEQAPHQAVYNREPCQQCEKYMEMGVILISVDEKKSMCREHTCRSCTHVWRAPIRMAKATANISGEMIETCPKCNTTGSVSSTPHIFDDYNPWRTGGWVVVKDNYIRRIFSPPELVESVLKKRVAFIPDDAWEMLRLPRGDVPEIPTQLAENEDANDP